MTKPMDRFRSALAIVTLAAAAFMASAPAATAAWDGGAFMPVQQKGGGERGDRAERDRAQGQGREARQERQQDERRDRMSEDDRRSLHRDLDKANRELYGRRVPK